MIPEVLFELMDYFETFPEHKKQEGIFRKSCSQSRLAKMNFFLMFYEKGGYNCLKIPDMEPAETNQHSSTMTSFMKAQNFSTSADKMTFEDEPHVVSNFIKKVFREMEEPLCQYKLINDFTMIGRYSQDKKPAMLLEQIRKMNELNRNTLMVTINFMRRFIDYADQNKMNAYNMSLMFAPNIFRDKSTDALTNFTLT